eukprot:3151411-Amphidinium_carterae.1
MQQGVRLVAVFLESNSYLNVLVQKLSSMILCFARMRLFKPSSLRTLRCVSDGNQRVGIMTMHLQQEKPLAVMCVVKKGPSTKERHIHWHLLSPELAYCWS